MSSQAKSVVKEAERRWIKTNEELSGFPTADLVEPPLKRARKAFDSAVASASAVFLTQLQGVHRRADAVLERRNVILEQLDEFHVLAIPKGGPWDVWEWDKLKDETLRVSLGKSSELAWYVDNPGPYVYLYSGYGLLLNELKDTFLKLGTVDAAMEKNQYMIKCYLWEEIPVPYTPTCEGEECYHHRHFPNRSPDSYHQLRNDLTILCEVCLHHDNMSEDVEEDHARQVKGIRRDLKKCVKEDTFKPRSEFSDDAALASYYKDKRDLTVDDSDDSDSENSLPPLPLVAPAGQPRMDHVFGKEE